MQNDLYNYIFEENIEEKNKRDVTPILFYQFIYLTK